MSDMKTRPAPASAGETALTYADAYRLPTFPYALEVLSRGQRTSITDLGPSLAESRQRAERAAIKSARAARRG